MNGASFVASRRHAATDAEMLLNYSAANKTRSPSTRRRVPNAAQQIENQHACSRQSLPATGACGFAPQRTPGSAPHSMYAHRKAPMDETMALDHHAWLQVPVGEASQAKSAHPGQHRDMRRFRTIGPPTTGVAFGSGVSQTPLAGASGFAAALAAASSSIQPRPDSARLDAASVGHGFPEWRVAPNKRPGSASAQMHAGRLAEVTYGGMKAVRAAKQAPLSPAGVFGTAATFMPVYQIR
jgi:hypothetical protein